MCPEISIIVPVYNTAPYLPRCIDSILNQSFTDFELLLIDDGSTDGSAAICDVYAEKDNRVRVVHKENGGVSSARNLGLDRAKGDFVTMVDSDDWLELNAIELLLKKQMETGADMVVSNEYFHTPTGVEKFIVRKCNSKEEWVLLQMEYTLDHTLHGKLFKRSLFEENQIRFIEGCDMAEDRYMLVLLAYFSDTYAGIDDFVYNYERRNDTSISSLYRGDGMKRFGLQYVINWVRVRDFFSDREQLFYRKASHETVLYMKLLLKTAIKTGDKVYFGEVTQMLDKQNANERVYVGWELKGIKGMLLHNYHYQRIMWQMNRSVRYVKRIVGQCKK